MSSTTSFCSLRLGTAGLKPLFLLAVLVLVLVLGGAGCGPQRQSPSKTLHNYAQALRVGNVDVAYGLMTDEFRAARSREEFAKMLTENKQEVALTAEKLAVEEGAVEIHAELQYGFGEEVSLRQENGLWRIASNPLDFYSQRTPRDAVRSLVRAYTLERWEVILKLVPNAYRERMTVAMVKEQFVGAKKAAMREMMETLQVNLNAPSLESVVGARARLQYGEDYEVELVREDRLWKIKDL